MTSDLLKNNISTATTADSPTIIPDQKSVVWWKKWSLGSKMLALSGLAFTVTVSGILLGFTLARQIESEAFAIQAEASEDVENIGRLKGSLLKFLFQNRFIVDQLGKSEVIQDIRLRTELYAFINDYENFKQSWQEFIASDEFSEAKEAEENGGVTEMEGKIAASILREHQAAIDEYIKRADQSILNIDPTTLTSDQLVKLEADLGALEQSAFVNGLNGFIQKITALTEATREEREEANELFQQASATQMRIMLVSTLLSGLGGLLLVSFLSRALLSPLRIMTTKTRQSIQEANFELSVPVTSCDEAGELAQTFNVYMRFVKQLLDQRTVANQQLQTALDELHRTQGQMIQSEKMSSLGQLVAGVAHEINNPVNFIHGNLNYLQECTGELMQFIQLYQVHYPKPKLAIQAEAEAIDIEFMQEDLPKMLGSMRIGTERIREIVLSLRNFSRLDESEVKFADVHEGLNSTLVILNYRLKALPDRPAIEVVKEYGNLPPVECYPGLLNQVFMNILANAIDALEAVLATQTEPDEKVKPRKITVRTALISNDRWVQIAIADNGPGMQPEVANRIFDPFFTTKPIGKGTGMGMSISYQIVTEKHEGKLTCFSTLVKGTEFVIQIPM